MEIDMPESDGRHVSENFIGRNRLAGCPTTLDRLVQFPGVVGDHGVRQQSKRTGNQDDVYRMIRRRAIMAGIRTRIGNHTFRITGITQYLRNGGQRELAQQMAAHESPRTTALYDRRDDEVERISI
jgi:hypothetical protein